MKKISSILILAMLTLACGNSNDEEGDVDSIISEAEEEITDEIFKEEEEEAEIDNYKMPESLNDFRTLFKTVDEFPIEIDSIFITKINADNNQILHYGEIEILSENHKEDMSYFYSSDYLFKVAYQIDSAKINGVYDDWINNTPSYEIQYAEAYALLKFKINKTECFIWAISNSTGDGSPHSSGTDIFITFAEDNEVITNYFIGEISSGGDAPMWGENMTYTTINKDGIFNISVIHIQGEDDYDTGEERITKSSEDYIYTWHEDKLVEGIME